MADDISFTISANDQASKVVETVQHKINNFGSDIAKMALGVAGPMALLQAGIGLVTEKWNEYKQAQKDSEQAQKDAFDTGASSVYDEVKAQESLGKELDKNLAIMLAIAKVKKEDAKNTQDLILQENALIEEYLKSEEARGVTTGGTSYLESSDFQNQFVRNIQNASRDEKLAAAKDWAEKKAQEFYATKYGPNSTPESRAAIDATKKRAEENAKKTEAANAPDKISAVNEKIRQAELNIANGGALTGQKLIDELKLKLRYAQDEYDTIQEGQASEIDTANARLKVEEAIIALRDEQTKQSKEQADLLAKQQKEAEALKKAEQDKNKLTVSSLREIGGSFGGGDVSTSFDRQIELAQKSVDFLEDIATNTAPKSDTGVSKPIGDTNFTDETD
jgi:hypothetical protein